MSSQPWSPTEPAHCEQDMTQLCNHRRKITAMATLQAGLKLSPSEQTSSQAGLKVSSHEQTSSQASLKVSSHEQTSFQAGLKLSPSEQKLIGQGLSAVQLIRGSHDVSNSSDVLAELTTKKGV